MAASDKSKSGSSASTAQRREILITRVFNAPRKLLWQTWTRPEHIAQWWGPRGFDTTVTELDFRPGGSWRYVMRGPDGKEYPVKGVFREIVEFEKIVTTDEFDEDFEKAHPGELPRGIVLECTFEDLAGKTRLTLRIIHPTEEDRRKHEEMGVIGGWNSSFECLDEHLAALQRQK